MKWMKSKSLVLYQSAMGEKPLEAITLSFSLKEEKLRSNTFTYLLASFQRRGWTEHLIVEKPRERFSEGVLLWRKNLFRKDKMMMNEGFSEINNSKRQVRTERGLLKSHKPSFHQYTHVQTHTNRDKVVFFCLNPTLSFCTLLSL